MSTDVEAVTVTVRGIDSPQSIGRVSSGLTKIFGRSDRAAELRRIAAEGAKAAREAKAAGLPAPDSAPPDDVPVSEEVERKQRAVRERALLACLPADRASAEVGLAGLYPDQHPQEIAAWLADPDELHLILAGSTGSGKTQAAYATAVEAARRGAAVRTRNGETIVKPLVVRKWTVNGYLAELRPDGSPEPVWEIRDRARLAELLILDDLGAEMDGEAAEFVRKELLELVEWRINARYRTIFTTNLRALDIRRPDGVVVKGLKSKIGDRLWSRLQDRTTALQFTGPDRRQRRKPLNW